MITADPQSLLGLICGVVDSLKEGECIDIDMRDLRQIPSFEHNGATFTPADRVLGNICGSAYTHSFKMSPDGRRVTFMRHKNTGETRYRDPDHDYRVARLNAEKGRA